MNRSSPESPLSGANLDHRRFSIMGSPPGGGPAQPRQNSRSGVVYPPDSGQPNWFAQNSRPARNVEFHVVFVIDSGAVFLSQCIRDRIGRRFPITVDRPSFLQSPSKKNGLQRPPRAVTTGCACVPQQKKKNKMTTNMKNMKRTLKNNATKKQ